MFMKSTCSIALLIAALIEQAAVRFRNIQMADLMAWKLGERNVEFEKLLASCRAARPFECSAHS